MDYNDRDDDVLPATPEPLLDNGDGLLDLPVQTVETVQNSAQSQAPETPQPSKGFWETRRENAYLRRLDDLNLGIELYPENATNYALRGELFFEHGHIHLAKADFETALALASEQVQTDQWGFVAQATQDRAMIGLRRVIDSE